MIDINCLEYAIVLIAYAGACLAYTLLDPTKRPPQAVLAQFIDNMVANIWTWKMACSSVGAKALSCIFSTLMIFSDLGTNAKNISTDDNIIADRISRLHDPKSRDTFEFLCRTTPSWRIVVDTGRVKSCSLRSSHHRKSNNAGTFQTCQSFFVKFCLAFKINDPALRFTNQDDRNLVMAC